MRSGAVFQTAAGSQGVIVSPLAWLRDARPPARHRRYSKENERFLEALASERERRTEIGQARRHRRRPDRRLVPLALKKARLVRHVVGVGRTRKNLQEALRLGVIDEAVREPALAVRDADVVVIGTPVGQMPEVMRDDEGAANRRP